MFAKKHNNSQADQGYQEELKFQCSTTLSPKEPRIEKNILSSEDVHLPPKPRSY
jgi:hypothetical protein